MLIETVGWTGRCHVGRSDGRIFVYTKFPNERAIIWVGSVVGWLEDWISYTDG